MNVLIYTLLACATIIATGIVLSIVLSRGLLAFTKTAAAALKEIRQQTVDASAIRAVQGMAREIDEVSRNFYGADSKLDRILSKFANWEAEELFGKFKAALDGAGSFNLQAYSQNMWALPAGEEAVYLSINPDGYAPYTLRGVDFTGKLSENFDSNFEVYEDEVSFDESGLPEIIPVLAQYIADAEARAQAAATGGAEVAPFEETEAGGTPTDAVGDETLVEEEPAAVAAEA